MSAPPAHTTELRYSGSQMRGSCGYCKTSGGNNPQRCNFFLRADTITAADYKRLIDRGWRRSGNLLYKPHMSKSCCPQYTIRMKAQDFKPSRDQRQNLHRWTRFVLGDEYIKEAAKKYPKSKEEKKKQNEFHLIESVHAPEYETLEQQRHIPPEPLHKLTITLEPSSFTEEKYQLFENYQRSVHHEKAGEISRSSFKRFLCESPIPTEEPTAGEDEENGVDGGEDASGGGDARERGRKFGSFHQLYRLDGRLIAMSVLDLLPGAVSGVYFIYHDDYAKWHLGKVSACREAALALEEGYDYYYMGYYIPSCVKMRYKGDYKPQSLLDPETNEWTLLDDNLRALLGKQKYVAPSALKKSSLPPTAPPAATSSSSSSADAAAASTTAPPPSKDAESASHTDDAPQPRSALAELDAEIMAEWEEEWEEEEDRADEDEDEEEPEDEYFGLPTIGFLFRSKMPGIMSRAELDAFDVGQTRIRLYGHEGRTKDIEESGLVTILEETVAAVGPEVAENMVLVLG